jgi:hypothetical protein
VSNHLQTDNWSKIEERLQTPQLVAAAADLTHDILDPVPDRLAHSRGVAHRAHFLTLTVEPHQARLLVAAAWLHDIGYAPHLRDTGFHPLDGARHLRAIGWPPAIYNLVAHHSGARFVARVRNLDRELAAYPFSQDAVSDALTGRRSNHRRARGVDGAGGTDARHARTARARFGQRAGSSPTRAIPAGSGR